MVEKEKATLHSLDIARLTNVVQKLLNDQSFQVKNWLAHEVQGGTIGEVYMIDGDGYSEKAGTEQNWSLVLKVQRTYLRFGDPESWLREVLIYESDLLADLPPTVWVPRCLEIEWQGENEIWLWMEKAVGRHGTQLTQEDYQTATRLLAHWQGSYLTGRPMPTQSWLSTQFWLVKNVADWGTGAIPWLLKQRDEVTAEHGFNSELVEQTLQLWAERDRFLVALHKLPQTISHRDFFFGNIFLQKDEEGQEWLQLIDWDCAGIGRIGEDLADLVGEVLVFSDYDVQQATELKEAVLKSYIIGLQEIGWTGEADLVRLGFDIHFALHWAFRLVCRFKDTEDSESQNRYLQLQEFILKQGAEARSLLEN